MLLVRLTSLLSMGLLSVLLSGCWVKKTTCRGLHNQMPDTCKEYTEGSGNGSAIEESGGISSGSQPGSGGSYTVPVAPVETTTETHSGPGFSLARVTPEQLSNNLVTSVNFGAEPNELRWNDQNSGQTHDYLQLLFGVPLGGVDFETANIRDRTTKAQTLLVARVVAMQLTQLSLGKEWNKAAGDRVVFNKCNIATDRPFRDSDNNLGQRAQNSIREGEERWNEQVEELFFRFYSRPPTAAEMSAVKTAFLAAMDAEGYPLAGWVPVLYAMLSSQEFWHQ